MFSSRTAPFVIGLLASMVGMATPQLANAEDDSLRIVNALRTTECSGHLSKGKMLRSNRRLNTAAKYIRDGSQTRDALKRADYRADQSAMVHIGGPMNDASLQRVLAKNYCKTLVDAAFTEVGFFRNEKEFIVVLGSPFVPPAPGDAAKVAQQVLQYVNEARTKPRRCGSKSFDAVPPLTMNTTLGIAALAHAKDMASRGRISHEGSDGSLPADRATRAGYKWKAVGENVASGQSDAREVVNGWLASPGHCVNIMDPDFTQMAVAYVVSSKESGIYWAQVFGKPR